MPGAIEGIFLPEVSPEEGHIIWDAVKAAGHDENGAGVKALLLDLILGEDEDEGAAPFVSQTLDYMKKNPDKVMAALASGKTFIGMAKELLKKKMG